MTLEELLSFLQADTEVAQLRILQEVQQRLGVEQTGVAPAADRVRILTMHGAKGLEGKAVFIPGFEQEMMPGRAAMANPGLLQERRRVLYVSITRAKACCVLSLASSRTGPAAQALANAWQFNPAPSQFLTELGVAPQQRHGGLTAQEVGLIVQDCSNL
jgi:DNA helicase-2/ATP-dependent DNA helicase PcrA